MWFLISPGNARKDAMGYGAGIIIGRVNFGVLEVVLQMLNMEKYLP